jgi:thymidylate synthase ThyX
MDKKVKYNFLGSLYQKTLDPTVRANPDTQKEHREIAEAARSILLEKIPILSELL